MTRVRVLWQTGAVNDFAIPRRSSGEGRITAPEVVALIRARVAEGRGDREIAAELNQGDVRTGARGAWDVPAVRRVRYQHGLHRESRRRPPDRRADGMYSVYGVAAVLGVRPGLVRCWIRHGWLQAVEGSGTGHAQWFRLDEETVCRLKEAKLLESARRGGQDIEA